MQQPLSEQDLRLVAQSSPAGLALATDPQHCLPRHIDLIDRELVRVAAGERKRLIITVPVRHGKSMETSQYFPAWLLGVRPDARVALVTYGARFSETWGLKARRLLEQHGPSLFGVRVNKQSRAAGWWEIDGRRGFMHSTGVGGDVTGKGYDVCILDDVVKNAEEARSEVMRENTWEWFKGTLYSRLEPGGSLVVLMARWHEDDLVGRIMANPSAELWDEDWTIINIPALAGDDDPLGRQPGEALWPERFTAEQLRARQRLDRYWFSALYQQSPTPDEGIAFKRSDFRYYTIDVRGDPDHPATPRFFALQEKPGRWSTPSRHIDTGTCIYFQTCDIAASDKKTADWTVVSTWAKTPEGDLLLVNVRRQQFETLRVGQFLKECNDEHWNPPMFVEEFGAGKVPLTELTRSGYPARALQRAEGTQTDKFARAMPAIFAYENHRVFHPQDPPGDWLEAFERELIAFGPGAHHDDQVDTASYAARLLPTMGAQGQPNTPETSSYRPMTGGVMGTRF